MELSRAMQGAERLCVVAKVFMDTRLLELKRENEGLKLKLFWKEHNPGMLKQAMSVANRSEAGPGCTCLACIVGGRCNAGTQGYAPYAFANMYDDQLIMSPHDICHLRCQFKPWFEQKIRESGMSVREMPLSVLVDTGVVGVLDDGKHFVNLGKVDWNAWVYGSRLHKASSTADPELDKLQRLFRALQAAGAP